MKQLAPEKELNRPKKGFVKKWRAELPEDNVNREFEDLDFVHKVTFIQAVTNVIEEIDPDNNKGAVSVGLLFKKHNIKNIILNFELDFGGNKVGAISVAYQENGSVDEVVLDSVPEGVKLPPSDFVKSLQDNLNNCENVFCAIKKNLSGLETEKELALFAGDILAFLNNFLALEAYNSLYTLEDIRDGAITYNGQFFITTKLEELCYDHVNQPNI